MDQIIILGCGSQARYVIDIAAFRDDLQIMGLADLEGGSFIGKEVNGVSVVGSAGDIIDQYDPKQIKIIIAHGNNDLKKELAVQFEGAGFDFASAISPRATISPTATIGKGCIINHGAVVMPNARLMDHVIVHSGCVIEHDCVLENFVNIAPGVAFGGNVKVGQSSYVYTGAAVIPKISIGTHSVVGAGATVLRDVASGSTIAGVPAKPIK